MAASRNAQLASTAFERRDSLDWQKTRLELLQPQLRQQYAKRRREATSIVFMALLLFIAAFAYMYLEAQINVAGRTVNDLQTEIAEVEKDALILELEIGNLSSLARVESYAKTSLGMVYPGVDSVQYLDQGVSERLVEGLSALTEQELVDEEAVQERHPLFVAWAELIGLYFSGTALAVTE